MLVPLRGKVWTLYFDEVRADLQELCDMHVRIINLMKDSYLLILRVYINAHVRFECTRRKPVSVSCARYVLQNFNELWQADESNTCVLLAIACLFAKLLAHLIFEIQCML
jgi:hypothetical protein